MNDTTLNGIREVLSEHARLPADPADLAEDANLFEAGMTSHASVNVMLALEDRFDVEFPDAMLTRSAFSSIGAIGDVISRLNADPA